MDQDKTSRELQAQWELAIERAAASSERQLEVEEPQLQDAAGLHIHSRVHAAAGSYSALLQATASYITWCKC